MKVTTFWEMETKISDEEIEAYRNKHDEDLDDEDIAELIAEDKIIDMVCRMEHTECFKQ